MCLEIWAALLVMYCISCCKIACKVNSACVSAHSSALASHAESIVLWKLNMCTGYTSSESCFVCPNRFLYHKKAVLCKTKVWCLRMKSRFFRTFLLLPRTSIRLRIDTLLSAISVHRLALGHGNWWLPRSVLALLIVSAPFALSLTVSPHLTCLSKCRMDYAPPLLPWLR